MREARRRIKDPGNLFLRWTGFLEVYFLEGKKEYMEGGGGYTDGQGCKSLPRLSFVLVFFAKALAQNGFNRCV